MCTIQTTSISMEDVPHRPFQYNAAIVKEFIETYECLPELWDARHLQYLNKTHRNAALGVLLKVLQKANPEASKSDVRKKINTLRSNYRRELKKIYLSRATAATEEDVYQPASWTFYSLTFLDSGEADRDVTNTAIEETVDDPVIQEIELCNENPHQNYINFKTEGIDDIYVSEEVELQPGTQTIEYMEEEYLEPEPDPVKQVRSKPVIVRALPTKKLVPTFVFNESQLSKNNEILKRVSNLLGRYEEVSQSTVWAQKLKNLDETQRMYAEKAINDILFEAGMGRLHDTSVRINDIEYHNGTDGTVSS